MRCTRRSIRISPNINGSMNKERSTSARAFRYFDQTYNLVANFNRTFNEKHTVNAMAGVEYYKRQYKTFRVQVQRQLPTNSVTCSTPSMAHRAPMQVRPAAWPQTMPMKLSSRILPALNMTTMTSISSQPPSVRMDIHVFRTIAGVHSRCICRLGILKGEFLGQ